MCLGAEPTCRCLLTLDFRRLPDSGPLVTRLYSPPSSHKTQGAFLSDPDSCSSAATNQCEEHFASNSALCTVPQHQTTVFIPALSQASTPMFLEIHLVHQMHRGWFYYCTWKNLEFCSNLLWERGRKRERDRGQLEVHHSALFLCVSTVLFPGGAED